MKYQSKISDIIIKVISGEDLSEEEQKLYNEFIIDNENRALVENLRDTDFLNSELIKANSFDFEGVRRKIDNRTGVYNLRSRVSWYRYAAAILIVMMATAAFWLINKTPEKTKNEQPIAVTKKDVSPGQYKARLTLSDGTTIILDSAALGKLAQQGNVEIQNRDGKLVYLPSASNPAKGSEIAYNTLTTANGETFGTQLSDGSKIWLNSGSSVRYPVSFTGVERKVEISGEAYFEVTTSGKPFVVSVRGTEVQVLGTVFNINAYADEDIIKTTLVEGKVKVKKNQAIAILKPRQQAQVVANEIKVLDHVEVDKITAWQQGYFKFKGDKLSEAMKNIARWYNVDLVYEGNAANIGVSGDIPRSANLSELIKLLAVIDVDARIEGRKMILKAQ